MTAHGSTTTKSLSPAYYESAFKPNGVLWTGRQVAVQLLQCFGPTILAFACNRKQVPTTSAQCIISASDCLQFLSVLVCRLIIFFFLTRIICNQKPQTCAYLQFKIQLLYRSMRKPLSNNLQISRHHKSADWISCWDFPSDKMYMWLGAGFKVAPLLLRQCQRG